MPAARSFAAQETTALPGRADSLRWVLGSLLAGLGALILVAPHRFSAPLLATATALRDLWGAAALFAGVALLAVAILQPWRPLAILSHGIAAGTLLALAAAFANSGIWIGTAAYLLLAAGAAFAALPSMARPEGMPRDLLAAVMAAVAVVNGVSLWGVPFTTRAAYFGPARALLPALGALFLAAGLTLGVAQLWRGAPRHLVITGHLFTGLAFFTFGSLVSARQHAWTALAVNWTYALALAWLPWAGPLLARVRTSPLWARLGFVLAASNSLALILTTALASRHHEGLVLGHLRRIAPEIDAAAEQALLGGMRRGRDLAMLLLLALAPVAIAAGVLLARRIARPLAGLAAAVDEMAAGHPPTPPGDDGIAEVARLATAFATLHQRLVERSAESARLADELRMRAAALEEMDRRKDEFLALLGHELRNPIGAIANSAYVLRQLAPAEPQLRRAGEVILRQVEHLIRLLEDLLDVSRITRGKVTLRRSPLDLREVIGNAVETTLPLIEAKRQELRVELPDVALPLHADGARLEQVIGNLLRNASEYTPAGGRIEVGARVEVVEVVVWVHDNGSGIPTELLPRVFEPFQQGPRTPGQGGLGIGLTLVKSLVELHGGRVKARSAGSGMGSELEVRLPVEELPVAGATAGES